jgi:hypothetical protein
METATAPVALTVTVEAPGSVFRNISKQLKENTDVPARYRELAVHADLSTLPNLNKEYTGDVPIFLPGTNDPRVTMPQKVRVTVEPNQQYSAKAIRVLPLFSDPVYRSFVIDQWTTVLPEVLVEGPPSQIALLRDRKFVPYAVLRLTETSKAGKQTVQLTPADFSLPDRVRVIGEYTVDYTARKAN